METSSSGSCGSGCGCGGGSVSRRDVLVGAMAAAAVGTVLVNSGAVRASGAVAMEDGTWIKTFKATDLVDKEARKVPDQLLMLSRDGKKVYALSNKCTHKGCPITPKPKLDTITCQCHKAGFDLEGNVTHPPAKLPLPRYALRLNSDGVIEVDMSNPVDHDAATAVLTLA